MAFCNSCGATLNEGMKFCNKCGAAQSGVVSAPMGARMTPPPPPVAATGGSSALKIVLLVIAVIVVVGILGLATVGFIGWRIAKSSHVHQEGDHVKVDTPFGTVSANDPEQAVKDLGIDVYPGAEVQKQGSSSMTFGSVRTVTAIFESSDSVDKVCSFYKSRFPNAMTSSSDTNRCNIVSNDQKNMITINIEAEGDSTKLQITNVSKR